MVFRILSLLKTKQKSCPKKNLRIVWFQLIKKKKKKSSLNKNQNYYFFVYSPFVSNLFYLFIFFYSGRKDLEKSVTIDFHSTCFSYYGSQWLYSFLLNIFFRVQPKKETNNGLEPLEESK